MTDADIVLRIRPLPSATPIPDTESAGERRLFEFLSRDSARHDEIETERRRDEAERRIQYEAERREQAEAMTQIAAQVSQVGNVVAEVSHRLAALTADVDTLKGLLLGLRVRFAAVEAKVSEQGVELHELKLEFGELKTRMEEIERRIEAYSHHTDTDPSACVDPLEPGGES